MLDWDDLRFFLAIVRHRTLAAAARETHVTQSTVRRRLASLEVSLGARLLQRMADGYAPTLAGREILSSIERVEAETLGVQRAVSGHDERLAGTVRLMGSQLFTSHLLAPCLAEFHGRDRAVMVELIPWIPGDAVALREADIAVQMQPFTHQDLIVRKLGCVAFGLYGEVDYIGRCGTPDTADGCSGHQLITLLDDRELSAQAAWLSEHAARGEVVLRSDSYETQHWSAASGGGLAVLPRFRADAEPKLRRLPTHVGIPKADIWFGVHRQNRDIPRVRAVLDSLAQAFKARARTLDPSEEGEAPPPMAVTRLAGDIGARSAAPEWLLC